MSLAPLYSQTGSSMAIPLFTRLIHAAEWEVRSLLTEILLLENKSGHTAVISAIVAVYDSIDPVLSYRAFKVTHYRLFDPDPDTLPLRLLLPNRLSPRIFAKMLLQLRSAHASAAAQFFLSHFEEAEDLLSEYPPDSPLLSRIQAAARRYCDQDVILDPIGRASGAHWLPMLMQMHESEKSDFSKIEAACADELRRRPHLTQFERSRIVVLAMLAQHPHPSIQSSALIATLNPVFARFLLRREFEFRDADAPLILSPAFRRYCRVVTGFTPHGLVAIPVSAVPELFEAIARASGGSEVVRTPHIGAAPVNKDGIGQNPLVAHLNFSLFAAGRPPEFLRGAVEQYMDMLTREGPYIWKLCAAARAFAARTLAPSKEMIRLFPFAVRRPGEPRWLAAKVPDDIRVDTAMKTAPVDVFVKLLALFDFVFGIDFPLFEKCNELTIFLRRCVAAGIDPPDAAPELSGCDSQTVKRALPLLKDPEIEGFVGSVVGFAYENTKERMEALLDDINSCLPLMQALLKLDPFSIQNIQSLRRIDDNSFCMTATVFQRYVASFLIEKVPDSCTTETWATGISALRGMFHLSFNARQRSLPRNPIQGVTDTVAVGMQYVMTYLGQGQLLRLSDFEGSSLADHFGERFGPGAFRKLRLRAIEGFAGWAVIRTAFAVTPRAELLMLEDTGDIIMPLRHFRIDRRAKAGAADICDSLLALFGPEMKG
jgi:hypothetical protein